MKPALIPVDLLNRSKKILFVAHLALGDYTYLQNCFQALARTYPHLKIHLWIDEVRRTADASRWPQLEKYSLYDWVEASPIFDKIYRRTYSPALYRESIAEAQREDYPIVVALANIRPHRYAAMARTLSPHGFVAGLREQFDVLKAHHALAYRKLDGFVAPRVPDPATRPHISDAYAYWFEQLFALDIAPAARMPFVDIPPEWRDRIRQRLADWGFAQRPGKLVFINPFAKTAKRCWPLESVAELIQAMAKQDAWHDACFIVNALPHDMANARQVLARYELARTELFSAEASFFQLPAMLAECDLIVSAETAVMHLANAVKVPVVALMRQKNPEWVPLDSAHSTVITTPRRRDWVKEIKVQQVMEAITLATAPATPPQPVAGRNPAATFHIAFCVDDNYCRAMGGTIASIISNNPGQHFTFHVLAFALSDANAARLKQLEDMYPVRTELHLLNQEMFGQFSGFLRHSHYSLSIFTRLVLPSVLEGKTDRVLYMDADILCVGRMAELIDLDPGNDIALVIPDVPYMAKRRVDALRLKHGKYFNSGVMLMNIARWQAEGITAQTLDVLLQRKQELRFPDQDALNIVLDGRARYISPRWNYIYDLIAELQHNRTAFEPGAQAVIVHFAGSVKPWAGWTGHAACDLFRHYLGLSPWSGLALDAAPVNTKEMRMNSRFLFRQLKPFQSLAWYLRYVKQRHAVRSA
jgi:lipopolysaccharide biosynthesis glycosyltransferase/ADP-heptose:LPS heptosyltransferase